MCSVSRRRVLHGFHRHRHFDILGASRTNMKYMICTANPDFSKPIYSCVRAFRIITTREYLVIFSEEGVIENFKWETANVLRLLLCSDNEYFILHSSVKLRVVPNVDVNFINLKRFFLNQQILNNIQQNFNRL